MTVSSRSNDRALARKGMLSSYAASSVRRTTPVTERCQPSSPLTQAARPPPRAPPPPRRAGGASLPRAAARALRAPAPRPPPRPPRVRPRPAARPPSLPRGRAGRAACATTWRAPPHPVPARTESRAPRRCPAPPGTARTPTRARSLARLLVVGRGHGHRAVAGGALPRRPHVAVHDRPRARHPELLEQERERPLEIGGDRVANRRRQIPQPPFEGADRLLAALVEELLLGIARFPLVPALGLHPRGDLGPQVGRQQRMVEDDVLEVGGEVDLDRLAGGEVAERLRRQRGRAVLHRPAAAPPLARLARQRLQGLEVELHPRDR